MKVAVRIVLAALVLTACQSGSQLSLALPSGEDNEPTLVRAVVDASQAGSPPDACFAVVATEGAVAGVPLGDGQSPWRRGLQPDSRPQLLGGLVVFAQGTTLHALSAKDGSSVFAARLPQARLIGAAAHGERLFAVTRADDGASGRLTAYDMASGAELDSRPLPADSGRPQVVGDLLLLPLQHQSVAVLEPATLHERGRLRASDGLLNFIQPTGQELLLGDEQVRALGPGFAGRLADLPELGVPHPDLPGMRQPFTSDYAFVPGGGSAFGRVGLRLFIQPAATGAPELRQAYAVFYRHVYAFSPEGELRWARGLSADVVQAAGTADGLLAVLSDGRVVSLDGAQETSIATVTTPSLAAALPTAACAPTGPVTSSAGGLSDALLRMLGDRDARLLPSQLFALNALQNLPGDAVTQGILEVASDTRRSMPLRDAARRALMARETGAPVLLRAAARSYDYLTGTPAPPMAVLSPALAAHGASEAVPVLRDRLFDHATPAEELVPIAEALASLDPSAARQALHAFLYRYRADSSFTTAPEVYTALAVHFAELTGATGSDELRALAEAETTHPVLRLALTQTLPTATATATETAPAVAETEARPSPPPPLSAGPRSYLLSAAQVRRTFEDHAEDIPRCLKAPKVPADVTQVRVALVVDAGGQPLERYYLPDDEHFIACMEPLLSEYTFPASGAPRQVVVYTWAPTSESQEPERPKQGELPFWHAFVPPAKELPKAQGTPFWQDQNPLYVSVDVGYVRSTTTPSRPAEEPARGPQGRPAKERTAPEAPSKTTPEAEPAHKPTPGAPDSGDPARSDSDVPADGTEQPWWAPTEG